MTYRNTHQLPGAYDAARVIGHVADALDAARADTDLAGVELLRGLLERLQLDAAAADRAAYELGQESYRRAEEFARQADYDATTRPAWRQNLREIAAAHLREGHEHTARAELAGHVSHLANAALLADDENNAVTL